MEKDKNREERIKSEILVDAYGEDEHAMGWYYYLEEKIAFPFEARVIKELKKSPLQKDETITVLKMNNEDNYADTMFVEIEWKDRKFGVPLEQLYPVDTDEDTIEAIEDWHYWINRGYRF